MSADADKLRVRLERYRLLLRRTTDKQAAAALRELIAEIEARLHAIEQRKPRRAPRRSS